MSAYCGTKKFKIKKSLEGKLRYDKIAYICRRKTCTSWVDLNISHNFTMRVFMFTYFKDIIGKK